MTVYAIVGIDTDIGKTIVTGILARTLIKNGIDCITQKTVQTGCTGIAEDIETHRSIMGSPLLSVDLNGTTCPFVYSFPASPHLAAHLDGKEMHLEAVTAATQTLNGMFSTVLLEGVGGVSVPLTPETLFIDYLEEQGYPAILVTSPRLGSINHTFLTLEALLSRDIPLAGIVYNKHGEYDRYIADDTAHTIQKFLNKEHISVPFAEIGDVREPLSEQTTGALLDMVT